MKLQILLSACMPVCALAFAQTGTEPARSLGARDVYKAFALPPPPDKVMDPTWAPMWNTQLLSRARRLGIDRNSAGQAWIEAQTAFGRTEAKMRTPVPDHLVEFHGQRASELNALLRAAGPSHIKVTSRLLLLDQPVRIAKSNVYLDLGDARLQMSSPGAYMVRVEGAESVRITGGRFESGPWALLVNGSRDVVLMHTAMSGLSGGGVLVTNSRDCVLWSNTFSSLRLAPVMLHGSTTNAVIAGNHIFQSRSPSNWRAGIVLTDRTADLIADPESLLNPDHLGVKEEEMVRRTHIPHDNLIAFNDITGGHSSGIYSDGGARNVIVGNRIEGNATEGICLDNGSLANVVAYNVFRANGKRWGNTDAELKLEFVLGVGRMPDGSSVAKTPGISLDNAAYNEVLFNEVDGNYGGGIKLVRTAFFNVIGLNTVTDNNEGRSARFHFFGIELGSAGADVKVKDLDFAPSRGNIVFGNTIRGTHYAGVFFAPGASTNTLFDNTIFGATNWSMESAERIPNATLNNLSNVPTRNISLGLDPQLVKMQH